MIKEYVGQDDINEKCSAINDHECRNNKCNNVSMRMTIESQEELINKLKNEIEEFKSLRLQEETEIKLKQKIIENHRDEESDIEVEIDNKEELENLKVDYSSTIENQKKFSTMEKMIEKKVDILKIKTAEDFYEEVAEIKLKNIELIEKIEWQEKEMEKVVNRERQLKTKIEAMKNQMKEHELKLVQQDEEKEASVINEAVERSMEVLLGNMTESAFELADILEETDQTLGTYKNDNEDLRNKLWKAIAAIEEKKDLQIQLDSALKKIKYCEYRIESLEEAIEIEKEENEELEKELKMATKALNEKRLSSQNKKSVTKNKKNMKVTKV